MKHVINNAKKLKANSIHFENGLAIVKIATSNYDAYTLVQPVDPANSGTYDVSTLAKFDAQSVIDGRVQHARGTASVKLIDNDEDVCSYAEFDESKFVPVPVELFDAIVQTGKVHGIDDTRPILQCVRIDGFHVVATDSYRLHVETLPADSGIEGQWYELDSYVKVLGDIVAAYTDEGALYLRNSDGATLICEPTKATMGAQFPNWQQLIPNSFESYVYVRDVKELIKGVKFAGKLLSKNSPLVIRAENDSLDIHSVDVYEEFHNVDSFDAMQEGEHVEPIGVHAKYLADALDYVKDSSTSIGFMSPLRPILLDNGTRRALVMPVRISSTGAESSVYAWYSAKAGA